MTDAPVLEGSHVRLEPLARHHIEPLLAAAQGEAELFKWTTIPDTLPQMAQYVQSALEWRDAGTALPFATVRKADGTVVGSTRFFLIERWAWPQGHPQAVRPLPYSLRQKRWTLKPAA